LIPLRSHARSLWPNPPFLRNRQQVDGFSGEERPLAVVEVPADRFAREIVGILAVCVMRLQRLNGKPLGGTIKGSGQYRAVRSDTMKIYSCLAHNQQAA